MRTRTILDGNAFYEIDEECLMQKQQRKDAQTQQKDKQSKRAGEERKSIEKRRK